MKRFFQTIPSTTTSKLVAFSTTSAEVGDSNKRQNLGPAVTSASTENKTTTKKQQQSQLDKGLLVTHSLPNDGGGHATIKLARGSVLDFTGHVIVNAANQFGVGGGGVDGAINQAGGILFKLAREQLLFVTPDVRIPTGTSKSTPSLGTLKSEYVIHTVGPDFNMATQNYLYLLVNAYKSSLVEMRALKKHSIAFSLLSAGVYAGNRDLREILSVGLNTVIDNSTRGEEIFLVAYTETEFLLLKDLFLAKSTIKAGTSSSKI